MHQRRDTLRLFIHGAGRRGQDAWPTVSDENAGFLSFDTRSTITDHVDGIRAACVDQPVVLFAHSIGAVPAVLATPHVKVLGLVLVEPALYDIARGEAVIERHIAAVTEARAQAADGNLRGSWGILRPLMFGGPLDDELWEAEKTIAEHWSQTNVPWGHGVRPCDLDGIRTVIVTGGWNDEYELIANHLAARGAEHVALPGAMHRPQDLPQFADVAREFELRL